MLAGTKRVMVVFGTRPDAIKMCPLVAELKKNPCFETLVCSTGQHREMLQQVLDVFGVIPDINLGIMRKGQTLADITMNILQNLTPVLREKRPDIVLVHGDTSTGFAAALCAFYERILIGHVEAGLRTFNKANPFPEEANRHLISSLADVHFAPTNSNKANLLREGILEHSIFVTGNTGIDAMKTTVNKSYVFHDSRIREFDFSKKTILVTTHRRENIGAPITNICRAIRNICDKHEDVRVIYPVHPNPLVQDIVFSALKGIPAVCLTQPLDVQDLHNVIYLSHIVATDSGGIQEEAPFLGKPVLVLREQTERQEAVDARTVLMVGTEYDQVYSFLDRLLTDNDLYKTMAHAINPYGDGHACERIVKHLKEFLQ